MDRDREKDTEDEEVPAPAGGKLRERLKPIARYAMLGFAPVVALAALIVALMATGNRSDQAPLGEVYAQIENLNASLQASRAELDNLKFILSREKALRADEHKKSEEIEEKIVQNVTRLQTKLKVAPTLEEQLRAVVSAPVAASSVQNAIPVPASAPIPANADKKPAPATPLSGEKKSVTVPATKAEVNPQVKALKKAIDQYNKQ